MNNGVKFSRKTHRFTVPALYESYKRDLAKGKPIHGMVKPTRMAFGLPDKPIKRIISYLINAENELKYAEAVVMYNHWLADQPKIQEEPIRIEQYEVIEEYKRKHDRIWINPNALPNFEEKKGCGMTGNCNNTDENWLINTEILKGQDKVYFEVLELGGMISKADIKHAYKCMLSKYHPDKVNHLGEELKFLAEKKTREIITAFKYLCSKYDIQ